MLSNPPDLINDYKIIGALGRGFYGAAYVAEWGPFKKKFVLKISPIAFYNGLKKTSFEDETQLHNQLASTAEHVVGIINRFDASVIFTDDVGTRIDCHVMVLDFIDGDPLDDYLDGKVELDVRTVCQIAIDLLRMRSEFEAHRLNHNDLHANNLIVERLDSKSRRVNVIAESIRVMAIDLGSISEDSKSTDQRHGDLYFIAQHVDTLLNRLLSDLFGLEDRDYRVALALQGIVKGYLSAPQNARQPACEDLVKQITSAYDRATQPWRPWATPLQLAGFADHYNAQTLVSWDVPRLLVDPEGQWLNEVTRPGPQIITGMRGCGKTMLLRGLDFHARAAKESDGEQSSETLERLKNDGYIGLFVSAQRLLDLRDSVSKIEHRLTRLFANYALQASRALLHLYDLDPSAVAASAHLTLANAVADYLQGADDLRGVTSIDELELRLNKIAVLTSKVGSGYSVEQAPAQAFPHLAEQLRLCSSTWSSSQVFFLLDDVSTRYIEVERVEELLSALLFQNTTCAFKFTSEWQTIELGLYSPGRVHPIRIDRDVSVFDLGPLVHQTINGTGKGKGTDFVSQILLQRARFHVAHPAFSPKELLGDVTLEQVAREIASSNITSKDRKQAYRGLSCLTNVCVGDIGDVIRLYEEIVKRASSGRTRITAPIASNMQSECFQELSSQRLYELNRRAGIYKDHALTFAEAANELLVRSYRKGKKRKDGAPARLRQYSSIYVRVTSDDKQKLKQQIDQLRDLIDAGVFVYTGGSARTKTKDSNPIQQFKLSYRKICGLAACIGLADRDRFELSGADLEQWLNNPDKEILLKNLSESEEDVANVDGANSGMDITFDAGSSALTSTPSQSELFEKELDVELSAEGTSEAKVLAEGINIQISELSLAQLEEVRVGAILSGLGFEERTLESNRAFSLNSSPEVVHLIKYDEPGYSQEILDIWGSTDARIIVHDYPMLPAQISSVDGLVLVDVSGLSKPMIFNAVRRELIEKGRVLIGHVGAEFHYPLDEDLKDLLAAERANDPLRLLESLAGVLKGEVGPYTSIRMLEEDVDQSRSRALIAFASAKHERLFSLMDRREFDLVDVMAPNDDGARSKVANYAAQFLCKDYQNANVERVDTNDLVSLVDRLDQRYLELYVDGGANVELGLTGSKAQAVAAAVLAAHRKIAQAWYLKPAKFDVSRFSKGVGAIRIFDVKLRHQTESIRNPR
ncbi:protein kinase family protein [Thermomonas brevis]|uniref:Protein kinase family protein n=1 Tax=Thermomonas brevis TaxID=215691 RepID=A0A7G9QQ53_9GAMM|nr:protein kinase family protein [Thermomonas brevis]QNN45478.1 protein kinase family protein [Thermomonas brevis]